MIRQSYLDMVMGVLADVYATSFKPPEMLPSAQIAQPYVAFRDACAKALNDFAATLPPVFHQPEPPKDCIVINHKIEDILTREALEALAQPFRDIEQYLTNIGTWINVPLPKRPKNPTPSEERAYERAMKAWQKEVDKLEDQTAIAELALTGTPLYQHRDTLLGGTIREEFVLPLKPRFEGTWMIATSGSGKTNALMKLIEKDLDKVERGEASVIVMDSFGMEPGRLLHYITRHARFAPGTKLHDRLVVLDPSLDSPLSLNLFDVDMERLSKLKLDAQDEALNASRDMIRFVMAGLMGAELTSKQGGLFHYLTEAMMFIPGATIFTLAELLEETGYEKHREHILKTDPWVRDFFEKRFKQEYVEHKNRARSKVKNNFDATKQELWWRIDKVLGNRTFRAMFAHKKNLVNFFDLMQNGSVIVISANRRRLGEEGMHAFGRFMLALIYQAAEQRLNVPEDKNLPVFCYVDECQDYIATEPKIVKLLDQLARKNKIGFTFAHQRPDNLSASVLDAVSSVAVRFATRPESGLEIIANRLRMEDAALLRDMPIGLFASYVRQESGHRTAMVEFPKINIPLMPEEDYERIKTRMEKYSKPPEDIPHLIPPPEVPEDKEEEEIHDEDWFAGINPRVQ